MTLIREAKDVSLKGTGRVEQPFKLQAGYHIGMLPVTVFAKRCFRHPTKAWGQHHGADLQDFNMSLLGKIDGPTAADWHTNLAGVFRQIQTGRRIDIVTGGHSLRIIDVNWPGNSQTFVILIYQVTGAVLSAKPAGSTLIGIDKPWPDVDLDGKGAKCAIE